MKLRIEHLTGSRAGETQSFEQERVRLGRAPDNDVVLDRSQDLSASARHCELFWAAGAAHLRDLGSQNGTYVNGERISSPVPIRTGDEVGLGREGPLLRLTVRAEARSMASSDPTLPTLATLSRRPRLRAMSWLVGVVIGLAVAAGLILLWWNL